MTATRKPRQKRRARPRPPAPAWPADALDKAVLLLVSGTPRAMIREAVAGLLTPGRPPGPPDLAAADALMDEARLQITRAAQFDPVEELGTGVTRLHDLYRRALAANDLKTALAAERKRLDLVLPRPTAPTGAAAPADGPPATQTDVDAARANLLAAGLGTEADTLPDLTRAAVARIVELTTAQTEPTA